ncbi:hypothetical protein LWI29_012057 [Acer saccharum]|uniref:Uncharacterized protein n=1 Tax=Acer saccharum TaxID=4024 RepID=A0AA39RCU0_ACESA|nr:hypothetical protein LWI29_012057 [Acer saccharum]
MATATTDVQRRRRRHGDGDTGRAAMTATRTGGFPRNPPIRVAAVAARPSLPLPSPSSLHVAIAVVFWWAGLGGLLSWMSEFDELDEVSRLDWPGCNTQHVLSVAPGVGKDYCKEGTTDRNGDSQAAEEQNLDARNKVNEGERESYGPWMQVSYGRGNRSHLGYNATGRKSGNQGKSGRQGNSERQGNGTDMVGINRNAIHEENKKGADSSKILMAETTPKKSGKPNHSVVVGSRFAILNDSMDEEFTLENKQDKVSSSKVLTEISNRNPPSKSQLNPIANKYLVDSPAVKCSFSKPFKENGREVWTKKTRKGGQEECSAPS